MDNLNCVVKIIDIYTLIIDAGWTSNIEVGDNFQILEVGEQIVHPETKESLGSLDFIKDQVEVVTVYEKMCVCKSSKLDNPFEFNMNSPMNNLIRRKALNIDAFDITPTTNSKSDYTIRVGDKARLIVK